MCFEADHNKAWPRTTHAVAAKGRHGDRDIKVMLSVDQSEFLSHLLISSPNSVSLNPNLFRFLRLKNAPEEAALKPLRC